MGDTVRFAELEGALRQGGLGGDYSFAEKILNVVRHADGHRLLGELESLQYLDPVDIAAVFGFPADGIEDVTPLDMVFATKVLVVLHQVRIHAVLSLMPSWDEIQGRVAIGTTDTGRIVREIQGGYLVSLSSSEVNAFLPVSDTDDFVGNFDTNYTFRVTSVDAHRRTITVSLA